MTSSRKANAAAPCTSAGTGTNRGSTSGTLTRANLVRRLCRTTTARFLLRFEMNGNGWPGSNASGVSSGKMSAVKYGARCAADLSVYLIGFEEDGRRRRPAPAAATACQHAA